MYFYCIKKFTKGYNYIYGENLRYYFVLYFTWKILVFVKNVKHWKTYPRETFGNKENPTMNAESLANSLIEI